MYKSRTIIFFIVLLQIPLFGQGKLHKGKIIDSQTDKGIGYVNLGVVGKNIGTVSDADGNFSLYIDTLYDNDSIRFSVIGYEPQTFPVYRLNALPNNTLYLNPLEFYLNEITVGYTKPKEIKLGYPINSSALRSGFSENDPGSELGIKINVKRKARLKDLNLNIGICTYDSVSYRVNIYQIVSESEFINVLTKPVYISFSGKKTDQTLTFDLWENDITVKGEILVAIELFKDLGEGKLLFNTEFFTGETYHRKTSQGGWIKSPGRVGMFLNAQTVK